jgi:hypothetical protein
LLYQLSGLGLRRGLPFLKFESNLVCAPSHHGKTITASHSPVNSMMIEQPRQLFHMDTVGPSGVRSMGGKWYVFVIVDVTPLVFTVDIPCTLQCIILSSNGNKEQSNSVHVWIQIQILSFISEAK